MELRETKDLIEGTIIFPVKYDTREQTIRDSKGVMVCDIQEWRKNQFIKENEECQNALGEKIAKLLNEYKPIAEGTYP